MRKTSLNWVKAAARAKKKARKKQKVPLSHHTWMEDSASGGQPSTCCEPEFLCEVDEDVEQEDKPGVRNLQHLCVLQEAKQLSKSPLHLVIAPSLHFQLGRIQ
ncbi:unnamed protein product [Camellia sinensis]